MQSAHSRCRPPPREEGVSLPGPELKAPRPGDFIALDASRDAPASIILSIVCFSESAQDSILEPTAFIWDKGAPQVSVFVLLYW
jgi:hypothetical protein